MATTTGVLNMLNRLEGAPAWEAADVTKSDSTADPNGPFRALWADAAGTISLVPAGQTTAVTITVAAGPVPFTAIRINSTGTSLSNSQLHGIR